MTEEQSVKPEENEEVDHPVPLEAHPDEIDNPDVSGYFTVLVSPDESVSISFSLTPKDEANGITTITTGFYRSQGGVVQDSIGGTNFCLSPAAAGQKITGGTSEKTSAFPPLPPGEVYEAILHGNLKKEGEPAGSFFLTKVIQLNVSVM